ncbi:hypothetical protein QBC45DRAFT_395890 [Copromyces sp. CBS 386.78]|uniref:Uncharacterized protein n=1 Tax=Pseudoneurospora amorphoporcata TaxID=241081 RepID=A0AAN6SHS1_9PEZI|nr:hypothetical protein QBC45DRAFT_395890 [Copromyces sp. CBS 386.78]KAK3954827.1 hypothetical protein QBC32DRAFT_368286 [Pseudoneurospora amorphoporcata]
MKFITVILTLAAVAIATPTGTNPPQCKPATYACAKNPSTHAEGWQVCDVTSKWVYAGDCPPKTVCQFLEANGSPYCIPAQW